PRLLLRAGGRSRPGAARGRLNRRPRPAQAPTIGGTGRVSSPPILSSVLQYTSASACPGSYQSRHTPYLFTSESVSEGHPDKIADQISDAVLDAILAQDKRARVACETMVKTGVAIVAGEITTSAWVDLEALTRKVILDIGYDSSEV